MNKQEWKDIEWLRKELVRREDNFVKLVENKQSIDYNSGKQVATRQVIKLIDQLDEPETLSPEWIAEKCQSFGAISETAYSDDYFIPVEDVQNLLVPKKMNILEIEAMLDDIGWWDSPTEEQVIVMAIEKGEIEYDGDTYKLVKRVGAEEPETVVNVISDYYKALERMKVVLRMEVDSNG